MSILLSVSQSPSQVPLQRLHQRIVAVVARGARRRADNPGTRDRGTGATARTRAAHGARRAGNRASSPLGVERVVIGFDEPAAAVVAVQPATGTVPGCSQSDRTLAAVDGHAAAFASLAGAGEPAGGLGGGGTGAGAPADSRGPRQSSRSRSQAEPARFAPGSAHPKLAFDSAAPGRLRRARAPEQNP